MQYFTKQKFYYKIYQLKVYIFSIKIKKISYSKICHLLKCPNPSNKTQTELYSALIFILFVDLEIFYSVYCHGLKEF